MKESSIRLGLGSRSLSLHDMHVWMCVCTYVGTCRYVFMYGYTRWRPGRFFVCLYVCIYVCTVCMYMVRATATALCSVPDVAHSITHTHTHTHTHTAQASAWHDIYLSPLSRIQSSIAFLDMKTTTLRSQYICTHTQMYIHTHTHREFEPKLVIHTDTHRHTHTDTQWYTPCKTCGGDETTYTLDFK